MDKKYDVFISYRRVSGKNYARTLKPELEKRGFHVFLDFDELKDGVFDRRIMDAISEAPVFLIVLSKDCLDRCVNEGDWVRQEILHAHKCRRHIVPVEVDKTFREMPKDVPADIRSILGQHQFSQIDTETLLQESVDKLVHTRIEPYVGHRQEAEEGVEVHIETDADCNMYRFKTFVKLLKAGEDNEVHLKPGKYKFEFVSAEFPEVKDSFVYTLSPDVEYDFLEVGLKERVEEVRRKAEEETRRKAEEEARRKAEEEARRKVEEAKEANIIGVNFYYGKNGKKQSYTEAVKWYRKAAEQGDADAQHNLGWMYERGCGVEQSDTEAVIWYRKAAEQGNAYAQYNLGGMYEYGYGVEQSDSEAVKWFRKAAEQGNADAQYHLGAMYYDGRGVEQSDTEAVRWYRKAAEQGASNAQYNLGWMYEGHGVEKSITEAMKWYRKAAEQGDTYAQAALERLQKQQ